MSNSSSLSTSIAGVELNNPLILASGVLGTTPGGLRKVAQAGAGAVTTKSLGLEPRRGHPSPNVVELDCGYLNAMGLPNPGVRDFSDELEEKVVETAFFASIYGKNPEEFARVAEIIAPRVDGIELNLSCPHAEKLGGSVGSDPKLVEDITSKVVKSIEKPTFAKLTPNVAEITEIGKAAEAGGVDGVVAINTLKGMAIDVSTWRPVLGNKSGGLSGPAIHPVAVKAVYDLYEALSIPIIGVGGVDSKDSLVELILAGASAVQIGTAIADHDLSVFRKLASRLSDYLQSRKLSVPELVGKAHQF